MRNRYWAIMSVAGHYYEIKFDTRNQAIHMICRFVDNHDLPFTFDDGRRFEREVDRVLAKGCSK